MMTKYLIEVPDKYFDTRSKWEAFLKEMETLDQSDPGVIEAIKEAKERLARAD